MALSILEAARKMNALGINQGCAGNVSERTERGMQITPSGVDYDELSSSQLVELALDGIPLSPGKPSSEWRFHADVYRARSDVKAIVHAHPPYSTALACLGLAIPSFHYMVAVAGGDSIRCAKYATFGTQELADHLLEALEDRNACLMANHGLLSVGSNLTKALSLAVEVETLAKQYTLAKQLGEPNILDKEEMARVLEKFKTYGSQAES